MKKSIIAIVSLIVIAAIIAALYSAYSKPSSSQPVQTKASVSSASSTPLSSHYDNFGIAFKYPAEWGIPKESFGSDGVATIYFDYSSYPQALAIYTQKDYDPMGNGVLDETFDQMIARFQKNDSQIYLVKDISADGVNGKELFYNSATTDQPYHVEAFFPLPNATSTYVSIGADYDAVSQATFDAIIASLKWDNSPVITSASSTKPALYTNNGIQFEYPHLSTSYASVNVQVGVAKVDATKLDSNDCYPASGNEEVDATETPKVLAINGIKFCSTTGGGVAAGSSYHIYTYMTIHNGNAYTVTYQVRTSNGCGAYQNSEDLSSPQNKQYNECLVALKNYDSLVVQPIQQSISTFIFTN